MRGPTIALLGLGTVGSAVARRLLGPPPLLVARLGGLPRLKWVLVRDPRKPRAVAVDPDLLTTDAERVLADPEVDVVIELMGGVEPARQYLRTALAAGRHVITANKALLAEGLPELVATARRSGAELAFEGAVAGGVPIIRPLLRCLAANRVRRLRAVLNGTCNYVLTLAEQGVDLDTAVRAAQEAGYAEADPSDDLSGSDAARKLAILAMLITGEPVDWRSIPRTGIDGPDFRRALAGTAARAAGMARAGGAPGGGSAGDGGAAGAGGAAARGAGTGTGGAAGGAARGRFLRVPGPGGRGGAPGRAWAAPAPPWAASPWPRWRLVASGEWEGGTARLSVRPELLPPGDPLLQAAGVENMILIEADPVGVVRFAGPGAGGDATASAVLADLIAIWRGERLPLPFAPAGGEGAPGRPVAATGD